MSQRLLAVPFLVNGIGYVPQDETAAILKNIGWPRDLVAPTVTLGRLIQLSAGLSLALGKMPELSSATLMVFLSGATMLGHPFWKKKDEKSQSQAKASFFVNVGLLGGLLFFCCSRRLERR